MSDAELKKLCKSISKGFILYNTLPSEQKESILSIILSSKNKEELEVKIPLVRIFQLNSVLDGREERDKRMEIDEVCGVNIDDIIQDPTKAKSILGEENLKSIVSSAVDDKILGLLSKYKTPNTQNNAISLQQLAERSDLEAFR